jgi:hypothetical protein
LVAKCGLNQTLQQNQPRPQLTTRQAAVVDILKASSSEFATIRSLSMRFRGIPRSKDFDKLDQWSDDAYRSDIYAMQRFSKALTRDLDPVRNAIAQPLSNVQNGGQINRLKKLQRAMYGREGKSTPNRSIIIAKKKRQFRKISSSTVTSPNPAGQRHRAQDEGPINPQAGKTVGRAFVQPRLGASLRSTKVAYRPAPSGIASSLKSY